MCGITGFFDFSGTGASTVAVLEEMTASLYHRGPNDNGTYFEENDKFSLGLGHRRLSIIDLSHSASQPMHLGDELVLVFNGEIYNYIELRETLRSHGYIFTTSGDSEVILYAYKHWGCECFKYFNGMWALAIWDRTRSRLILSRDRFGKKPLYYYKSSNQLVFASEIKALLKHPSIPKIENEEKITRYLAYNYRYVDIDTHSFYKDVFHVPKSGYFDIAHPEEIESGTYWELDLHTSHDPGDDDRAKAEFRDLLVDSVSIRLRSDIPVGCLLSGGLDSSSIAAIATRVLGKDLEFFSGITGKGIQAYDESEFIEVLRDEIGFRHKYVAPDPCDLIETLDEMLSFHDEPVCTVTWYNLYLICRQIAKDNIHVLLNGHGGDELLGGYWDHYQFNLFDLKTADPSAYDREIKAWQENHQRNPDEIAYYEAIIRDKILAKGDESERHGNYLEVLDAVHRELVTRPFEMTKTSGSLLKSRLHSEIMSETIPASLRAEDRNSMAFSIESRSPFLDYRLVEYCFSLPNHLKIREGLGKWLLRQSMEGILPDKIRLRRDKAGFVAPADEWFRTVNRKEISDFISSPDFRCAKYLDRDKVQALFKEHLEGKKNHHMFIWQMINVELWLRQNF